ncbi:MAG: elongation factor P [Capsulimonadaceae bacterium]|nr:elongation factor P [Capsulimonadaceae bacterium]
MDTSDFKNGLSIIQDGDIFTIVEFQHVKPGKGGAFVRTTLRNARNGRSVDKTFRAGERMEQAVLEKKTYQYLYNDGEDFFLMDKETFEQIGVRKEQIGDGVKYLKENMDVALQTHKDQIIGVEVPTFVELEVTETAGSEKGDTASGGGKPATVETGAVVTVPFFVKVGDKIKIDTRTDTYLERVK